MAKPWGFGTSFVWSLRGMLLCSSLRYTTHNMYSWNKSLILLWAVLMFRQLNVKIPDSNCSLTAVLDDSSISFKCSSLNLTSRKGPLSLTSTSRLHCPAISGRILPSTLTLMACSPWRPPSNICLLRKYSLTGRVWVLINPT